MGEDADAGKMKCVTIEEVGWCSRARIFVRVRVSD